MAMAGDDKALSGQIRQIRTQLHETFDGRLDTTDIDHHGGDAYEQRFLSRALAALAVKRVAQCTADEAAKFVCDGIADQGLDAIAPLPDQGRALLVQAKWSDRGTATFDDKAAKAMVDGLSRIDNELFQQFNQRAAVLAEQARPLMVNGKAVLVIALMGTTAPLPPAAEVLQNALDELNKYGAQFTVEILYAGDFYDQIHSDLRPRPVELKVEMSDWYQHKGTPIAFQGSVSAEQIASWYEANGSRLFEQNLRAPLGATSTNVEIGETLTWRPTRLWHLNNGITMICDTLDTAFASAKAPHSHPVTLDVSGASVVNGAQTVKSIAQAMLEDGEAAANATVSVKVIETRGDREFAQLVSQATNRQNAIEQRDRVALDAVHEKIKADLRAELVKLYVIKRGEAAPAPETGCTLDELALALACLHSDPAHCARVASSIENLWEQGKGGSYPVLFGTQPSPQRAWRSVLTLRTTKTAVYEHGGTLSGRAASVAEHGSYLATHIVTQHLGTENIDDPDTDFDWQVEVLDRIPDVVPAVVHWLLAGIDLGTDDRPQIRAAFQNPAKCRELVEYVLGQLTDKVQIPAPPARERKPRRQNTVPLLVDHRVLKDGTPLTYYGSTEPERTAMATWLAENPRRETATWVNDRRKPIIWDYDRRAYSPSGLVKRMWAEAWGDEAPVANQGTDRWYPSGGDRNLWGLALAIHVQQEEADTNGA